MVWYDNTLRVVQTILRSRDAVGYDAKAFIDHALRLNANTVVINGGGLFAFYPTKINFHHRVPGLGSDIVGDVVEEAHRAGLKVLARVDFRAGHPDAAAEHPSWFAHDETGAPIIIRGGLHSCPATSPYRADEFAYPVLRELLSSYDLDGIWENAPSFMAPSRGVRHFPLGAVQQGGAELASWGLVDYSEPTRSRFLADTGMQLPRPDGPDFEFDFEAYASYLRWRSDVITERTATVRKLIKSFGDLAYISEGPTPLDWGWGHHSGLEMARIAPLWDIISGPTFDITRGSRGSSLRPVPVWRVEESAKLFRSLSGGRVPTIMTARFDNASRYTTVARDELELWLAAANANGAGYWETTFVGRETAEFLDQRCDDLVQRHYGRARDLAPWSDRATQLADVAILHSEASERWLGSADLGVDHYVQNVRGVLTTLMEHHIPYDFVSADQLTSERLDQYAVVVAPRAELLSDRVCAILRAFVEAGGGLVGTGPVAARTELGVPRDDLGLADVFGASLQGTPLGSLDDAYARIAERGPLAEGFDDTEVVTTEGLVWPMQPASDAEVEFRLIPEVLPQPPELGWVEDMNGTVPLTIRRRHGAGRAVLLTAETDRLAVETGHPDHGRLIMNAISWAAERRPLVITDAPASVHVNVLGRRDDDAMIVHLLNYSSGPGRPIRDIVPVHDVTVSIRRETATTVTDPLSSRELPFEIDDGYVTFTIPRLDVHAAITIE